MFLRTHLASQDVLCQQAKGVDKGWKAADMRRRTRPAFPRTPRNGSGGGNGALLQEEASCGGGHGNSDDGDSSSTGGGAGNSFIGSGSSGSGTGGGAADPLSELLRAAAVAPLSGDFQKFSRGGQGYGKEYEKEYGSVNGVSEPSAGAEMGVSIRRTGADGRDGDDNAG